MMLGPYATLMNHMAKKEVTCERTDAATDCTSSRPNSKVRMIRKLVMGDQAASIQVYCVSGDSGNAQTKSEMKRLRPQRVATAIPTSPESFRKSIFMKKPVTANIPGVNMLAYSLQKPSTQGCSATPVTFSSSPVSAATGIGRRMPLAIADSARRSMMVHTAHGLVPSGTTDEPRSE